MGWERPLVDQAVNYLTKGHRAGALDLTGTLLVVPTAHSGQRLREKLALYAASKGTVVFPARIVTPDYLFSNHPHNHQVIDNVQCLAIWTHILLSISYKGVSSLLPVPPERPNFDWAIGVARQLIRLRHTLTDYGYQFVDVFRLLDENFDEKARWQDLAKLEKLYQRHLNDCGLIDRVRAINDAVTDPNLPSNIKRIIVIAVPDPIPLFTTIADRISESIPVEVCVYAPESDRHRFDDWGRPRAEKWLDVRIPIPEEKIYLVGNPNRQAEKVREVLNNASRNLPLTQIALGVPDERLIPHLDRTIKELGIASHYPGGVKAESRELYLFISSFQKFLRHQNYDTFSSLIRHPEMLDCIVRENPEVSAVRLLSMMDEFQNAFLPSDFRTMLQKLSEMHGGYYHDLRCACSQVQVLLDSIAADQFATSFLAVLSRIYDHQKLNLNDEEDRLFCDVATLFVEHLSTIGDANLDNLQLESPERLEIVLETLKSQILYPERQPNSIDLLGWLELLWEDAPHVVISGMNSGIVPEAIVGDPFLPESLRKLLHMKDNDQRFARDAYMLTAIVKSRANNGVMDIVIGKSNDRAEPLKPSRLLFLCDDSTLPSRSLKLFGNIQESHVVPPTSVDLRLCPSIPEKPLSPLPVTSFRDYLSCPFRFFLKHILQMEALDDRKTELDALDFGQVCHLAFEEFGQNTKVRDCKDPDKIGSFLVGSAENQIKNRFGKRPPVSVIIQREAIKKRLQYAAQSQAEIRNAGWKIVEVEKALTVDNAFGSRITIKGKIDRIDVHEENNQIRLIDYKTSDTAVSPEKAHLKVVRYVMASTPYAYFEMGKKMYRWIDLQLPLYSLLLGEEMNQSVQCGYFNLPKALLATGLQMWNPCDEFLLEKAEECIRGVIDSVARQIFWPPASSITHDPFEWILLNKPSELVDPRLLAGSVL